MPKTQIDKDIDVYQQLSSLKKRVDNLSAISMVQAPLLPHLSHNLIKNYPSIELADGTQPMWWSTSNLTLTEEDATGEGITPSPNERVLKGVTSAAGGYFIQSFVPADEKMLYASNTRVSLGTWVYLVTAGTVTVSLVDSVTGTISSMTTTETGAWVFIQVVSQTIGANTLQIRFSHSANTATFYIANPVLNTGPFVDRFLDRGVIYKHRYTNAILNTNPTNSNWTDLDLSAACNTNTVALNLGFVIQDSGTGNETGYIRYNGSSQAQDNSTAVIISPNGYFNKTSNAFILCDENQIIEWSVSNITVQVFRVSVKGYWEWR